MPDSFLPDGFDANGPISTVDLGPVNVDTNGPRMCICSTQDPSRYTFSILRVALTIVVYLFIVTAIYSATVMGVAAIESQQIIAQGTISPQVLALVTIVSIPLSLGRGLRRVAMWYKAQGHQGRCAWRRAFLDSMLTRQNRYSGNLSESLYARAHYRPNIFVTLASNNSNIAISPWLMYPLIIMAAALLLVLVWVFIVF